MLWCRWRCVEVFNTDNDLYDWGRVLISALSLFFVKRVGRYLLVVYWVVWCIIKDPSLI